jgi:hypothetical protein
VVVFGGSRINWINNHMNCGRYPVFHVLREEEVLAAVDKLDGNASRVCRSNVNLLGRMEGWYGREGAAWAMERGLGEGGATPEGMDKLLREVRRDQLTSAIWDGKWCLTMYALVHKAW